MAKEPKQQVEPETVEPKRQATLSECNAHARVVEAGLKEQAKEKAALEAAAYLKSKN